MLDHLSMGTMVGCSIIEAIFGYYSLHLYSFQHGTKYLLAH